MNPLKRLGLAALLVVGVTLLASTPARAGYWTGGTIELWNTGDEPEASGEAKLTHVGDVHVKGVRGGLTIIEGRLAVTCHNLTPGATYWTPAGTFTANSNGDGSARRTVVPESYSWDWSVYYLWSADVYRLNPDGSYTLVLAGVF